MLDKVLEDDKASVMWFLRKVFYASTYEHAKVAVELFKKKWSMKYPSAVECPTDNIEDYLTLLQISLPALVKAKDDQYNRTKFQGSEEKGKR